MTRRIRGDVFTDAQLEYIHKHGSFWEAWRTAPLIGRIAGVVCFALVLVLFVEVLVASLRFVFGF